MQTWSIRHMMLIEINTFDLLIVAVAHQIKTE